MAGESQNRRRRRRPVQGQSRDGIFGSTGCRSGFVGSLVLPSPRFCRSSVRPDSSRQFTPPYVDRGGTQRCAAWERSGGRRRCETGLARIQRRVSRNSLRRRRHRRWVRRLTAYLDRISSPGQGLNALLSRKYSAGAPVRFAGDPSEDYGFLFFVFGIREPALRASLSAMATACLRSVTVAPPPPDFKSPSLNSCMTFSIFRSPWRFFSCPYGSPDCKSRILKNKGPCL